ncbi:hypothetical protein KGF56_002997 [Candida oxycetoniae]|uniref:Rho-GAP domain-containing protein n=1 Tax=Candida oxycetoniae TaxID=497107 RepID=A0AAI9SWX3_9ASCO|nr:uncharacterized protein KGF56_002997 [Candida oxycetoniae]KAI3404236.2 hypothetical protein KGF56_002997 [Candida oxycetoniae]
MGSRFFADNFWSADYITGLSRLKQESTLSINQLHDFRKLAFSYLKYYFSNSEYFAKSIRELFDGECSFANGIESLSLNSCYNTFISEMESESVIMSNLAASIDKYVVDDITKYLKFHEPKIKRELSRLEELYDEYVKLLKNISKTKHKYVEQLHLKEFAIAKQRRMKIEGEESDYSDEESYVEEEQQEEQEEQEEEARKEARKEASYVGEEEEEEEEEEEKKNTIRLRFPLRIGPATFDNLEELKITLSQLIAKTPTTKRTIPLPGYKEEIFVSDSICNVLTSLRIRGLSPSRSNLEKFGQGLLDLKLITPTNIFSRKFKSEAVWFEWSDLALQIAEFKSFHSHSRTFSTSTSSSDARTLPSKNSARSNNHKMTSPASKLMNNMAETTTRFNAMFNTVKSSILKTNHSEILAELLDQYNDQILELQEYVYFLEKGLFDISQYLEKFEKVKIQIIYKCSAKLSDLIVHFHHQQVASIDKFSKTITQINQVSNYESDFDTALQNFKSGIYFPISHPLLPQKEREQVGNLPQNLEKQFDLFNDIPLQLLNCQVFEEKEEEKRVLSVASVPVLLYEIISILELEGDINHLRKLWLQPIDFQSQWRVKQELTQLIADYATGTEQEIQSNVTVSSAIITMVIDNLKSRKTEEVIVFLKCWLMEIKDSVIPFIVFDSVVNEYAEDGKKDTKSNLIKHLGSIPRSNLASLLCIMEHICKVFDIYTFSNYRLSDSFPEASITTKDDSLLESVSKELNSMQVIGGIPFVHLIMRPCLAKNFTGFKPPLSTYVEILANLINPEIRLELFHIIVNYEKKLIEKKEIEKQSGLQVKRMIPLQEQKFQFQPQSNEPPKTPKEETVQVLLTDEKSKTSNVVSTPPSEEQQQQQQQQQQSQQSSSLLFSKQDFSNLKAPQALSAEAFSLRPFKTRSTPTPSPLGSPKYLHDENSEPRRARSASTSFLVPKMDIEFEGHYKI